MGYGTRSGTIKTFWPDETENKIYIDSACEFNLNLVLECVAQKWGSNVDYEKIRISSERIQTNRIGWFWDSSDLTTFLVIERIA